MAVQGLAVGRVDARGVDADQAHAVAPAQGVGGGDGGAAGLRAQRDVAELLDGGLVTRLIKINEYKDQSGHFHEQDSAALLRQCLVFFGWQVPEERAVNKAAAAYAKTPLAAIELPQFVQHLQNQARQSGKSADRQRADMAEYRAPPDGLRATA